MPPRSGYAAVTVQAQADNIPVGFPVTQLIETFLNVVAANVSLIPRDVYTLGQVFSGANLLYKGVLGLIGQVESTPVRVTDLEPGSVSKFEAYTTAVPELER